jgi:hypothetical protein
MNPRLESLTAAKPAYAGCGARRLPRGGERFVIVHRHNGLGWEAAEAAFAPNGPRCGFSRRALRPAAPARKAYHLGRGQVNQGQADAYFVIH